MRDMIGKTIVLWSCPGFDYKNRPTKLTGLFTVEDRYLYEPSNYCYSDGFLLFPVDAKTRNEEEAERAWFYCDDPEFIQQVSPKAWGDYLYSERLLEHVMEEIENDKSIH